MTLRIIVFSYVLSLLLFSGSRTKQSQHYNQPVPGAGTEQDNSSPGCHCATRISRYSWKTQKPTPQAVSTFLLSNNIVTTEGLPN